jgi:hypothetical protein
MLVPLVQSAAYIADSTTGAPDSLTVGPAINTCVGCPAIKVVASTSLHGAALLQHDAAAAAAAAAAAFDHASRPTDTLLAACDGPSVGPQPPLLLLLLLLLSWVLPLLLLPI